MNRWGVCKRDGRWRVYDGISWYETHDTLAEAHTAATQLAITTWVFQPGALAEFFRLKAR
jgi:hypothetical protein